MSFIYPLGLLGLIGIPILIIIYIIKNKYTEQVISSTYIWTLSEKFLKRRNPINKLAGIISLILQILAVLFISVAVAHPVFVIPNSAYEYCFILDGTGSMNIVSESGTRLDAGKERIASIIDGSFDGCTYTLIYVGNSTQTVYEPTENKDRAIRLLNELEPTYADTELNEAQGIAQAYFNENPSVKTYLITDKMVDIAENVFVVDVSSNEENYAVADVEYTVAGGVDEDGKTAVLNIDVKAKAVSYQSDATLEISLYFDDETEPADNKTVEVGKLQAVDVELSATVKSFKSFRVVVENKDALPMDNEVVIYSPEQESSFKALIVSDRPFLINAALRARNNVDTEVVSVEKYDPEITGYNLYVFDCAEVTQMPRDGAVWFLKPYANVQGSGFTVRTTTDLKRAVKLSYNSSSASIVTMLTKNLLKQDVEIRGFVKIGLNRGFTTIMSYDGNPMLVAGTNEFGNREVVFAFDIHESSLAGDAAVDYNILMNNLLAYTFPDVITETNFTCGDTLQINVIPNCSSIRIDSPSGAAAYLNTGSDIAEYTLTEVGVYTITLNVGEAVRTFHAFASLPEAERYTTVVQDSFSLNGTPSNNKKDGTYDDLLAWFIILALLFAADWMVYCYEQYQLR